MSAPAPGDTAMLDAWWATFVATGSLPAELLPVQGRLIRCVHKGQLPSGPVFVKTMTFPRAKDRLRYLLRALPGAHEAKLLRAVAQAGIPCPEVVDCRTQRRAGLPARSLLVLRALPVVQETRAAAARLRDEAELTLRLLRAGIEHRDLHTENFVRLTDGALAVLDLQSASVRGRDLSRDARIRLAAAARLLRDAPPAGLAASVAAGLVRPDERAAVGQACAAAQDHYRRGRVLRCLQESTEFTVCWRWWGIEHRRRRQPAAMRSVVCADGVARTAWLGDRVRELDGATPMFCGYARRWWWLGRGAVLYVPADTGEASVQDGMRAASACWHRFAAHEHVHHVDIA